MKIASYTITRNGLTEGTLEATLDNLNEFADYTVIVVSEDSDDGTIDWLEEMRDEGRVDDIILENMSFPEQESEIRKLGYDAALQSDPDWVAAIDDDEIIPQPGKQRQELKKASRFDIVSGMMYHVWEDDLYRADGTWKPRNVSRLIFGNANRDHGGSWGDAEVHSGRLPLHGSYRQLTPSGHIPVLHYGWRKDQDVREEKTESKKEHDNIEGKETDYAVTQRQHYESIYDEPDLEKIPEQYVEWHAEQP